MSLITNFDTLANLRREAQIGGVGSKAYFAFCDTIFESFPKIYEKAKTLNRVLAEMNEVSADLHAHLKQHGGEQRLTSPAMVGNVRFHAGISERTVIEAAQARYQGEVTPEKEAERIAKGQATITALHKQMGWITGDGEPAQAEMTEEHECELCGGTGQVQITPYGAPDEAVDSYGCPICIEIDRNADETVLKARIAELERVQHVLRIASNAILNEIQTILVHEEDDFSLVSRDIDKAAVKFHAALAVAGLFQQPTGQEVGV